MNTVVKTESGQVLDMIGSALVSKDIDVEKMERLFDLHERFMKQQKEAEFNAAMNAVQGEVPAIMRNCENNHTRSRYANMEAVNKAVVPCYQKEGLSLSFGTEETESKDVIRIVCDVLHRNGHSKRYTYDSPLDGAGAQGKANKTPTQAAGSAITYGRRYLTAMIFNLTIGDDDDGNGNRVVKDTINEEQIKQIDTLLDKWGGNYKNFCAHFGVSHHHDLLKVRFGEVVSVLEKKIAEKEQ